VIRRWFLPPAFFSVSNNHALVAIIHASVLFFKNQRHKQLLYAGELVNKAAVLVNFI
jgi:hypothetical protein